MAQSTLELKQHLPDRIALERRAKLLAHVGNSWHLVEFGIALGAGIAASSVALTSFAGDSLVEVIACGVRLFGSPGSATRLGGSAGVCPLM
ncbi:MAG TPA: hypothetical protein VMG37_25455 [Solirubrobacteraceae bacterium]|nr:hypothetical protein [Solirubrobacteraceae bacterium]